MTNPDPEIVAADPGIVSIADVSMRFGSQSVLRDISLTIPRGQSLAIIGESGCGKTVLLKLIVGLLAPSSGRVSFDGRELIALPDRERFRQRLRIGFLFQGAALFDSLTVYENVAFGLRSKGGLSENTIRDIVHQRLDEVGLAASVVGKMPAELSGGMKKRVGLARALALDPEVMLYDEPTTGLDPIMTDVINELIQRTQEHAEQPITSIIVTHEMRTVRKVAERIVMLYPLTRLEPHEPQILVDGSMAALESHPDHRVHQFVEGRAGERLQRGSE